jgi:hypothetical protein
MMLPGIHQMSARPIRANQVIRAEIMGWGPDTTEGESSADFGAAGMQVIIIYL